MPETDRQSGRATTSLWLGIGSLVLSVLTGVPAVVLGRRALRDIERGDTAVGSRAIAWAGIFTGVLGTLASPFLYMYVFVPMVQEYREEHAANQCSRHLLFIGVALSNYHKKWKAYPPTYVADENGKRIHSWRGLLTPHLNLYTYEGAYDLDEPWDSAANRPLEKRCPELYQCPLDLAQGLTTTSYVAVTGPGFVFDGGQSIASEDIPAGAGRTLAFVEWSNSGIHWTEPKDITFDELVERHTSGTVGKHKRFYHAMMANGQILKMPYAIEPELLRTWFTIIDEKEEAASAAEAAANEAAEEAETAEDPTDEPAVDSPP